VTESIAWVTQDFSPNSNPPLPGGCAYYRCFLPMSSLRGKVAVSIGYPAWMGDEGFGVKRDNQQALFGFDRVVIKLLMQRNTVHQMQTAQDIGQFLIVDVDDWYEELPESNQAHWVTDPKTSKLVNREHYRDVIMQADRVTVSTEFLRERYAQMRDNVVLVRNTIDVSVTQKRPVMNRKPVIGWVGGIPWRGGDLETLQSWLPDFLEKHDLMFHHSGHMPDHRTFAELSGVNPERVTTSSMQPMNQYYLRSFNDYDIGIVPLNDIPFNHAKSNLKGLEYAASGIPFVAQGLPEYRNLYESGVGRIADTPEQWVSHLEDLLDYKTRKREAAINYSMVQEKHTLRNVDWFTALAL